MPTAKTNAMRILDTAKIEYKIYSYDAGDGKIDGAAVAEKIGMPKQMVFKTLVTQSDSREYYVFVVPVESELNLKAAAKAVGEKSVAMIKVNDLLKVTGYIRGGCSPIGLKKPYRVTLDTSCGKFDSIIISAGKIGFQVELSPKDLAALLSCKMADLCQ